MTGVEASDSYIGFLNSTIQVTDSSALAEEQCASKAFAVIEGISIVDILQIMKGLKLSDALTLQEQMPIIINKALEVIDSVYVVEVTEIGQGDRRTRLFLVMGDVAVQLTGYIPA